MTWLLDDVEQRAEALDTSRSFIVQAPAGSGKTGILVYRMLGLLAKTERPEQVLAITFTKKASKEMRERVVELLVKAEQNVQSNDSFKTQGIKLAQAVLANSEARGWQLLDMPYRLNISTIDSLCANLVSSMPWLSRLGERPKTIENASEHYQYAVEQLLNELLDESSSVHQELLNWIGTQDFNYRNVRSMLVTMLKKRDQWQTHLLSDDLQREYIERAWRKVSASLLDDLNASVPPNLRQEIFELAQYAAKRKIGLSTEKKGIPDRNFGFVCFETSVSFPNKDFADLPLWIGLKHFLLTSGALRKPKGVNVSTHGMAPKTAEKDRMIALLEKLEAEESFISLLAQVELIPNPTMSDQHWRQVESLLAVLKRLLAHLQLRFHNQRECDFSEVSQRANRALFDLGKPTDLALRMDYQIQHILVDEFQDTSHSQFRLLENLTRGWQRDDGRTLFLVGDPMQSIYRFRQAEVGLFLQAMHQQGVLNNIQLNPLILSENFRSQRTLVDWFNHVFSKSFPRENDETTGAIVYAPATSHKGDVQPELTPNIKGFFSEEEEAEYVADMVQQALTRGDKKIAILVRSRSQLPPILSSLNSVNVAYEGVDIQELNTSQSMIDALNLCKAIIRLDDKIAWLALLRGPLLGLTLTQITELASGKNALIWERLRNYKVCQYFSEDTQTRIASFTQVMQAALKQKHQVSLSSLVQWTWQQLGGNSSLQGVSKEDLNALWRGIAELEQGGDIESLNQLENILASLYAKTNTSAKTDQTVTITTMHKSKGLQYDTVILPFLNKKGRNDDVDVLSWAEVVEGKEKLLLLAPKMLYQDKENSHYHYLTQLEKQRSQQELNRLLYVACTRAETHLYLSLQLTENSKQEVKPLNLSQSILRDAWQALELDLSIEGQAEEVSDEQEILDQTLYRLPANFKVENTPAIDWKNALTPLSQQQDAIEYEWATTIAKAVGIVLHNFLQHHGHSLESIKINEPLKQQWRAELHTQNLENAKISSAIKRLSFAVTNMQKDPRTQWIFANHENAQNEYSLTSYDEGKTQEHRIDRTFIDKEGMRWIIDYKSTSHYEGDTAEFVDEQVKRHKSQMERYRNVFSQLEKRPIKLGLYFPLLKEWREL